MKQFTSKNYGMATDKVPFPKEPKPQDSGGPFPKEPKPQDGSKLVSKGPFDARTHETLAQREARLKARIPTPQSGGAAVQGNAHLEDRIAKLEQRIAGGETLPKGYQGKPLPQTPPPHPTNTPFGAGQMQPAQPAPVSPFQAKPTDMPKDQPYASQRGMGPNRWGTYGKTWMTIPDQTKRELLSFPHAAVTDYLYLMDLKSQGAQAVNVDGKTMATDEALKYVYSKMKTDAAAKTATNNVAMGQRVQPQMFGG